MNKNIAFLALLGGTIFAFSQDYNGRIGINTTTPKATLDIVGQAQDETKIDGLIPPRLTFREISAKQGYGREQTGTMVYITDASNSTNIYHYKNTLIREAGYYYWDGERWQPFKGNQSTTTVVNPVTAVGVAGWQLTGNRNITADNFLGTLDDNDISFKRNNQHAGKLSNLSTSFGVGALPTPTMFSVAIGNNALKSNVSGMSNTAIGFGALGKITNSEHSVAVGNSALRWTTGGKHAVVGSQAFLYNTSGVENTGVGFNLFYENKTGSGNVRLGFEAGYFSLGNRNIAIGYGARNFADNSGNNQLNIGNVIFGVNMSELFDNREGKIGIGIKSPNETLEVNGNIRLHQAESTIITDGPCSNVGTIAFYERNFYGCTGVWKQLNL